MESSWPYLLTPLGMPHNPLIPDPGDPDPQNTPIPKDRRFLKSAQIAGIDQNSSFGVPNGAHLDGHL